MIMPSLPALFSNSTNYFLSYLRPFFHSKLLHQLDQFSSHTTKQKQKQVPTHLSFTNGQETRISTKKQYQMFHTHDYTLNTNIKYLSSSSVHCPLIRVAGEAFLAPSKWLLFCIVIGQGSIAIEP